MKTIWMTSLVSSEDQVKKVFSQLKTYGLEVKGHFWEDNLEKMAWMNVREELLKPDVALWLILASKENLLNPSVRYGLALLTITLQAKKGLSFPLVILTLGDPISSATLPTPLKGADLLSLTDPVMAAKLVSKVHAPVKPVVSEYRLDIYGMPQIGQWFEVGPGKATWPGALFGVTGAEISFHAVGPKGNLPGQSVLNYPLKGLKLTLREKEHTAWAVQNQLDPQSSYFVKVMGFPESILFGSYAREDAGEVYVVELK
ncbi:MAG: hypothetical protein QME78_13655 [Thermodesulfobacteriota bacterium]|nr:hypothetical protein [Thermodesulfobacteriota bacterium]